MEFIEGCFTPARTKWPKQARKNRIDETDSCSSLSLLGSRFSKPGYRETPTSYFRQPTRAAKLFSYDTPQSPDHPQITISQFGVLFKHVTSQHPSLPHHHCLLAQPHLHLQFLISLLSKCHVGSRVLSLLHDCYSGNVDCPESILPLFIHAYHDSFTICYFELILFLFDDL